MKLAVLLVLGYATFLEVVTYTSITLFLGIYRNNFTIVTWVLNSTNPSSNIIRSIFIHTGFEHLAGNLFALVVAPILIGVLRLDPRRVDLRIDSEPIFKVAILIVRLSEKVKHSRGYTTVKKGDLKAISLKLMSLRTKDKEGRHYRPNWAALWLAPRKMQESMKDEESGEVYPATVLSGVPILNLHREAGLA